MGKLISLSQAQRVRQRLRKQGKTAVFTNGVFDLLHVGHIRYLDSARRLGDCLFVGLNSDASARRLKGADRPYVPEAERAQILCALLSVDYVILFSEPTAELVVAALQPDVYVKGGDYPVGSSPPGANGAATGGDAGTPYPLLREGKTLPEAPLVESYGGRVVILAYTPSHSTTDLVARIRQNRKGP
jgi:rfaE bifunctional protein nucleotidyltransferase chain/domain